MPAHHHPPPHRCRVVAASSPEFRAIAHPVGRALRSIDLAAPRGTKYYNGFYSRDVHHGGLRVVIRPQPERGDVWGEVCLTGPTTRQGGVYVRGTQLVVAYDAEARRLGVLHNEGVDPDDVQYLFAVTLL